MPPTKVPPSLEELLALKKGSGKITSIGKNKAKTKFLTKFQREKLEKEKVNSNIEKLKEDKPKSQVNLVQKWIDDDLNEEENDDKKMIQNRPSDGRFKFDWDESEDTSNTDIGIIPIKDSYDYSLDLPFRKRNNINNFDGFHWSKKPLDKMSTRDWRIFKEDFDITVKGNTSDEMIRNWKESSIPKLIIDNLERLHYNEPTPIQRAAIPLGLKGRDIVGIAETGSGKTLAFLIPAISYVMNLPPVRPLESPYVLIIVPTRELAQQIEFETQKFMNRLNFNVASIVGGHSYDENVSKLEKGVEILIGTPGRLLDILEKKIIELNRCFFLIADEADRMIDMGFEKQVKGLLDQLPPGNENPFPINGGIPRRTTMMFTATLPPSIEKLMSTYLTDPITITVGNSENAVESVIQQAIQVPDDDDKRMSILRNILVGRNLYRPPIIIFVNYQKTCDILGTFLTSLRFKPAILNGSKNQTQREEAISRMKSGDANVLVATDVAARGIDIPNVSLVINYQMTKNISEYVHRIGRTGRAGQSGTAITLWNLETDAEVLLDLKNMISNSSISICPDDLKRAVYTQAGQFRNIET
ncbi:mRNA splicing protein prp28 [Pichia californica]|uniref:RNA helicase n=1 Tax=Pichia californica TaxID=460514 RepID=A0A9P7BH04_9ASCO|nr:mRNA splicing protein prp28 [[Candida] californica]KAG0689885.1 mRNA splicing protein prp28 [[Candida] californica]